MLSLCVWSYCCCMRELLYVNFVCVKLLYVKCVWRRREEKEPEEKAPGIQNQKQEPHTKMWGKTWFFSIDLGSGSHHHDHLAQLWCLGSTVLHLGGGIGWKGVAGVIAFFTRQGWGLTEKNWNVPCLKQGNGWIQHLSIIFLYWIYCLFSNLGWWCRLAFIFSKWMQRPTIIYHKYIYIYKHIIHNVGFYGSLSVSTGWTIGFWSANMEFNPMKGRWLIALEEGFLGLQGSFAGVFHKQVKSQKTCLIPSGRLIVVRTTVHLLLRMKLYSRSLNTSIEVSHLWILCYTVFFVGQFCFSQSVTSHKCI